MDSAECRRLWDDLTCGRCRVIESRSTDENTTLVLAAVEQNQTPLPMQGREFIERISTGVPGKVLALESGLAASTVAMEIKRSLETLGCPVRSSKMPLVLAMLGAAARTGSSLSLEPNTHIDEQGRAIQTLCAPWPKFSRLLSPAVCEVARLRVMGNSHAEIAARRRTSLRTVANQLAEAFRRLGVSGRFGLLSYCAGATMPTSSAEQAVA